MFKKVIAFFISFCFVFEQVGFAQIAGQLDISARMTSMYNSMVFEKYHPLHLRYLSYDQLNNDFKLLLDKGSTKETKPEVLQKATGELLKYFFIGIALPNDTFWVNLRPDSPKEIINDDLAKTDIGKIMLECDLQLKKDTAKYTSPETLEGKEYWEKLYKRAEELYGSENITIPTLTRPWIVPDEIIVREAKGSAYIYKATLKVMLEQDYLKGNSNFSFPDEKSKILNEYSSQIIRETIIPKLTREINSSKRYASLRQVYYSLILAQWFKQSQKGTKSEVTSKIDTKDLANLTSQSKWDKGTYFKAYQKSFKDGEYNIQENRASAYGQTIRTYFSGGTTFDGISNVMAREGSTMSVTNGNVVAITEALPLFLATGNGNGEIAKIANNNGAIETGSKLADGGGIVRAVEGMIQNFAAKYQLLRVESAIRNVDLVKGRSGLEYSWQTDQTVEDRSLVVLKGLLQSRDFAEKMAEWLDGAYYRSQGKPAPAFLTPEDRAKTVKKSYADEKIAMNVAGFYALECGIGVISAATGMKFVDVLERINDENNPLPEGYMLILARFANATWKAGQPFRGIERIERPVFIPAQLLSNEELKKDFTQIKESAKLLLIKIREDQAFSSQVDQGLKDINQAIKIFGISASSSELKQLADSDETLVRMKELLQSRDFAEKMAEWLDGAYYRSQGKPAPAFLTPEDRAKTIDKSYADEKIAMNVAGFYALECGLGTISVVTGEQLMSLLQKVKDGTLPEGYMLILARFANATWKAGQPFRDLGRIQRDVFIPALMLEDQELQKDFVQIKEAAVLLFDKMEQDPDLADIIVTATNRELAIQEYLRLAGKNRERLSEDFYKRLDKEMDSAYYREEMTNPMVRGMWMSGQRVNKYYMLIDWDLIGRNLAREDAPLLSRLREIDPLSLVLPSVRSDANMRDGGTIYLQNINSQDKQQLIEKLAKADRGKKPITIVTKNGRRWTGKLTIEQINPYGASGIPSDVGYLTDMYGPGLNDLKNDIEKGQLRAWTKINGKDTEVTFHWAAPGSLPADYTVVDRKESSLLGLGQPFEYQEVINDREGDRYYLTTMYRVVDVAAIESLPLLDGGDRRGELEDENGIVPGFNAKYLEKEAELIKDNPKYTGSFARSFLDGLTPDDDLQVRVNAYNELADERLGKGMGHRKEIVNGEERWEDPLRDGGTAIDLQNINAQDKQKLIDGLVKADQKKTPITIIGKNGRRWTGKLTIEQINPYGASGIPSDVGYQAGEAGIRNDIEEGQLRAWTKINGKDTQVTFHWAAPGALAADYTVVDRKEPSLLGLGQTFEYQEVINNKEGDRYYLLSTYRVLDVKAVLFDGGRRGEIEDENGIVPGFNAKCLEKEAELIKDNPKYTGSFARSFLDSLTPDDDLQVRVNAYNELADERLGKGMGHRKEIVNGEERWEDPLRDGGKLVPSQQTQKEDANAKGPLGGIDFRALPIITQPMGELLMKEIVNMPKVNIADLDQEWQALQKMIETEACPSTERIKEFLGACYQQGELKQRADKVLACLAGILRIEEDECKATEPQVKVMLALLEYNR